MFVFSPCVYPILCAARTMNFSTTESLSNPLCRVQDSRNKCRFTAALYRLPQDDPRQRCPDISLVQNLLAWTPRVQLRQGLMMTIQYFGQLLRSLDKSQHVESRSPVVPIHGMNGA